LPATLIVMESRSDLAAALPVLYRAALDAVDGLSHLGRRQEATKLRDQAIRAYSRAWDDVCRRTLEEVQGKAVSASAIEATRRGRPLPGAGQAD
jgi:cell wall assembly regulator SMI1